MKYLVEKVPVTKCSYADKYQAIRPPTCGCDVCAIKWRAKHGG